MIEITGIRFKRACKVYDFNANGLHLRPGDNVIVEVEKGLGLGIVSYAPKEADPETLQRPLKKVVRKADSLDMERQTFNNEREEEAYRTCKEKIAEHRLPMKLIRVEYLFDSSKAIFYFISETRVDFRELVKELATGFHTRIEMRQVGVRDEAKMIGGLGPCGRELCCAGFLPDFAPVTIKMAKDQNLALNPAKISGICGRLMCCLGYEHEMYKEEKRARKAAAEAGLAAGAGCGGCGGHGHALAASGQSEPAQAEAADGSIPHTPPQTGFSDLIRPQPQQGQREDRQGRDRQRGRGQGQQTKQPSDRQQGAGRKDSGRQPGREQGRRRDERQPQERSQQGGQPQGAAQNDAGRQPGQQQGGQPQGAAQNGSGRQPGQQRGRRRDERQPQERSQQGGRPQGAAQNDSGRQPGREQGAGRPNRRNRGRHRSSNQKKGGEGGPSGADTNKPQKPQDGN
ncbi:MAG: stage 0 sporulation protein [Deltaproteobacteria bacterium]|nr:stage 0 sporulation protein [Deltaproteobacteria bacterium]